MIVLCCLMLCPTFYFVSSVLYPSPYPYVSPTLRVPVRPLPLLMMLLFLVFTVLDHLSSHQKITGSCSGPSHPMLGSTDPKREIIGSPLIVDHSPGQFSTRFQIVSANGSYHMEQTDHVDRGFGQLPTTENESLLIGSG